MKTTHTPGPWKIDTNKHALRNMGKKTIVIGGKPEQITAEAFADSLGEAEANAALIAAAPELLEALKEARKDITFLRDGAIS